MSSIWDVPFIVCDVETTGADAGKNRLTDIACVTVVGGEIVSEFSSLINPHQFIPQFIQKMTGITNEMAFTAPEADFILPDVARLFNITNAVFVAHNYKFDWSFIEQSFIRSRLPVPDINKFCTLKLARRLLDPSIKKNVGNLAHYFKIKVRNRHRALGDAKATALVLIELLELAESEHNIKTIEQLKVFHSKSAGKFKTDSKLKEKFKDVISQLPDEPGVYYFLNNTGRILYVGKAKSLRERVSSYFGSEAHSSKKVADLVKRIGKIRWEVTESELSALINESREIKRLQPPFNIVAKRYMSLSYIKIDKSENFPRLEVSSTIDDYSAEYYGPFRSQYFAEEIIKIIEKKFKLRKCEKINLKQTSKPCFYYHIDSCPAPCSLEFYTNNYEEELQRVRDFLSGFLNGIIEFMEDQMYELSEQFKFEEAAELRNKILYLKKLFKRNENISTTINDNNLVFLMPVSEREKTFLLIIFRAGRLLYQCTLGKKAPLDSVFNLIHKYYFDNYYFVPENMDNDSDEIKIVTSWLYKQQSNAHFIYLGNKTEHEFVNEVQTNIHNLVFD
ncbi:MAG: DEDD exonuclease domain-containing protein [Candidatus Kapabacteria bacterium]|nr:DEDD exonuclease domain-containing protein [Candidatus Kapabacteria bacterium]